MIPLAVFSDLDGTLLDHLTYRHDAAAPALAALRRHGVPLVLASSKTAAEIAPIRRALGFGAYPAIVENGGGILPGEGVAHDSGTEGRYGALRALLDEAPAALRARFRGFGDMDRAEIAQATGLAPEAAALAAQRRHCEPGLFDGDAAALSEFTRWLSRHGVKAQRGGRFLTLSFGADKAERMAEIAADLRRTRPGLQTLALGDAPNDAAMIEAADIGFVVANPHGAPVPPLAGERTGRTRRTQKPGPQGWNAAVLSVIRQMEGDSGADR